MGKQQRNRFTPVYALQDSATGLYYVVEGNDVPRLATFDTASVYPATPEGRLSAYTRAAAHLRAGCYELVRRDA